MWHPPSRWRQTLLKYKQSNCLNSLAVKFLLLPKCLSSFPKVSGFWHWGLIVAVLKTRPHLGWFQHWNKTSVLTVFIQLISCRASSYLDPSSSDELCVNGNRPSTLTHTSLHNSPTYFWAVLLPFAHVSVCLSLHDYQPSHVLSAAHTTSRELPFTLQPL